MIVQEYLLSYGATGEFGRFRPLTPLSLRRGDRAVVRSHRGLELAHVLCPAAPGHARVLPNTTVGQILRAATPEDVARSDRLRDKSHQMFTDARRLAGEQELPLEVLDVEALLDGEHAILHHLSWADFDERPLVSSLSKFHGVHLRLHTLRTEPEHEEDETGCGRPGCGKESGGSCGTGGGCSTCSTGKDMKAYFASLREQMHRDRVPLL